MLTGLPKTVILSSEEVRHALEEPVNQIVDAIKSTLDKTPPELAADIMDRGIVLAGGGALLLGLDERLRHETHMPVHLAESPLTCVAVGSGRSLEEFDAIHRSSRSARLAQRPPLLAVQIRELDPRTASDEDLLTIHRIEEACSHERPFRSPEVSLGYYRVWANGDRRWWLAGDDGAAALMTSPPSFNYAQVLVRPGARRRGIGTALLAEVVASARAQGIASFFAHHSDEAGAAFARRAGAVDDQRDVQSEVRLRDAELPEPRLPAGWRLLSWIGPAPEELVESYARARAAIDDAPTPGDMTLEPIDVAWVRRMEATAASRRRESRVTVAIDTDDVVGSFTDLRSRRRRARSRRRTTRRRSQGLAGSGSPTPSSSSLCGDCAPSVPTWRSSAP